MSCSSIPAKVLKQAAEAKDATAAVTKLERERAVLAERCETLESRCTELTTARDAAEALRAAAAEAHSVSQAERKLVDDTLGRADTLVGELRAERGSLITRATEAEAERNALQKQFMQADARRAELQEALAVEQVEGRAAVARAEGVEAQITELNKAIEKKKSAPLAVRLSATKLFYDKSHLGVFS